MVDSIVLRIHGLLKNREIVNYLLREREGMTAKQMTPSISNKPILDEETGELLPRQDEYLQLKKIMINDFNKEYQFYKNKKMTSSHYYLGYQIRYDKDYIEFNFSIPKYIYGTNLIQFVPHREEMKQPFIFYQCKQRKEVQKLIFDRLIRFIKLFIQKEACPNLNVYRKFDFNDLEINRLDICFNQHFDSKEEALKYLSYQKRIKKKFLRDTSENKTDWGTSIFLKTDRYSLKIYHKGTEYRSKNGEKKHHLKMNKLNNKEIFKVESKRDINDEIVSEGLEDYADKILRYEISFRSAMMSYLFKRHLYAKECNTMKNFREAFNKVDSAENKYKRRIQKYRKGAKLKDGESIPRDVSETIRREIFAGITKEDVSNASVFKSIMAQRNSFRLKVCKQTERENESLLNLRFGRDGKPRASKETLFSKELLNEMFKVFNSFLSEFKVEFKEQFTNVTKRVMDVNINVEAHNELIKDFKRFGKKPMNKMSEKRLRQYLSLLEHYTLDEMVEQNMISRSTKYNLIRRLKRVGVTPMQLLVDTMEVHTSFDFDRYYNYFMKNTCNLNTRNRFFV